jgi:hypothetical protein
MGKFIQSLPILVILLSFPTLANLFSLDPCAEPTTIIQNSTHTIMESGCYKITFTNLYNETPIEFYDKYNNDYFDLKLFSLLDVNTANQNLKRTTGLEELGMTISIEGEKLNYKSPDNKIILTYEIQNMSVKAGIKIFNWTSQYPTGRLELRTRIHKEDTANSHFLNTAPIVDGVVRPITARTENAGLNQFIVQTLFEGTSFSELDQDPLYVVDYSPIPAQHLQTGRTSTGADSTFSNLVDIHEQISDNLTITTYPIFKYIETRETWETGTFTGGSEWLSPNWTEVGECYITNLISPLNSTYHLEMRGGAGTDKCNVGRGINLSNSGGANLTFWAKANSIEAGEFCYFTFYNGTQNISLMSITDPADDGIYRQYSFNLTPYGLNSNSRIFFHTNGANPDDRCYVDNISVTREYGNAIMARWSVTYDPAYLWTIHLYSTTGGTQNVSVIAYNTSDAVGNTSTWKNIAGTGWFDLNVSAQMDYMTNTIGLSFTQLRITSQQPINISEVFLRQEVNDTTNPTIHDCYVEPTEAGCLEEIEFDCKVSDNVIVDEVIFTINGINYTAEQYIHPDNSTRYEVYFNPTENTSLTSYTMTDVYAKDIVGLTAYNSTSLSTNYSCIFEDYINITHDPNINIVGLSNTSATIQWTTSNPANSDLEFGLSPVNLTDDRVNQDLDTLHSIWIINLLPETTYYYNITSSVNPTQTLGTFNFTTFGSCTSSWLQDTINCLTNDTYLITYSDMNNCAIPTSIPIDNGTYGSCNYCSASLSLTYTSDCYQNGSDFAKNYTYTDDNYYSCCALTGLISDCPTDYSPYNETFQEPCIALTGEFQVEYDPVCEFDLKTNDKCYWKIFLNGTTGEYKCLSFIRTTTDKLLQTNPTYTAKTDTLITLKGTEYDDRTYFATNNGLGNVYFTKENLIVDASQYVFSVQCSNGTHSLQVDKLVSVEYANINNPIARGAWSVKQIPAFMLIIIATIIILFVVAIVWGIHKRNS